MRTRFGQWGNSLAVRIPKSVALQLGLHEGQEVEVSVEGDRLTLQPKRASRVSLEALLAGITDENLHGETHWGPPAGREEW